VTTISQDVEDFVNSEYGKPIISNAACQLLLKQSTSSIKALEKVFGLSEAEQQKLVSSGIGE
jgi:conjugal transfer ATP-binding protein TraC